MRASVLIISLVLVFSPMCAVAKEKKLFAPVSTTSELDHDQARAGMPQNISRWATPSIEKREGPGYIGGGKLIRGDARASTDGTFGWDYQGLGWRPGRFFLGWAHDRPDQPKLGTYKTDTHHVPDVFSLHPVRKLLEEKDR